MPSENKYEIVITYSKELEGILQDEFGATGKGLHENITSISKHLPEPLIKQLRFIATVRNKVVHSRDESKIPPMEIYINKCEESKSRLQSLIEIRRNQEIIKKTREAADERKKMEKEREFKRILAAERESEKEQDLKRNIAAARSANARAKEAEAERRRQQITSKRLYNQGVKEMNERQRHVDEWDDAAIIRRRQILEERNIAMQERLEQTRRRQSQRWGCCIVL